jgi:hypothetical protein
MKKLLLAALITCAAARPVDRYSASWATPPGANGHPIPAGAPSPPEGPYAGNGDVNVIFCGNASANAPPRASTQGWQQWLYLSKNDLWGSDSVMYYKHLSAGRVGILVIPAGAAETDRTNGTVAMFPGNSSIVHSLVAPGGAAVAGSTRVLENNVLATTLVCRSPSGGACNVTVRLSDTNGNVYGVAQGLGASPDGTLVWWRKENLHTALNPAYLGSCNPNLPLQSTERVFTVAAGSGNIVMANHSCLWSDEAAAPGMVTVGACVAPQGVWSWNGSTARGDIVHVASAMCLTATKGGQVALGTCGTAPWSQLPAGDGNSSNVFISAAGGAGCIVAVPDNNNNTLGVALGVADATGSLVSGTVERVSPTNPAEGITLSLSFASGAEYTLLVGLQTLRDIGCAGIRPQWETCATPPEAAAASLVRSMASPSALQAEVQASDAFWSGYWAASSVDLTSAASAGVATQLSTVERWYYLSQYLLACTTRDGKVTSSLDGFVCIEPTPWDDQFTLDYNLEATFWGAGSSNRLAFIHPVMASTTNPGAVATARLRAQNPGTWGANPRWPGSVGHSTPGAVCMPDCQSDPHFTTGFKGHEWPSAGMPLGDNRLADSDLQTRFIGGLLATNLLQYWEYSRNLTTLAQVIYPFVRNNAEFYASYAVQPTTGGKLAFPYSCAQEGCACRDAAFVKVANVPVPNFTTACTHPDAPFKDRCPDASGWELNHPCYECFPDIATGSDDGYHNAHPDIAFASSSFRNAMRFATLLGVDGDRVAVWQAALDNMPPYPSADFTWVEGAGSEFNGGAGFLVEAEYGHHPGVFPNGSMSAPLTWPWCNKEYPIANFAAMWPTDEIGATQTADQALLARAKQTVYALNNYAGKPWANTNGFCLSWPPAVRLSGHADAAFLIDAFATAIDSTTVNNACVLNHGGMLENIGATVAINDLVLQSHGGVMRFFPVWNATALGAASFTTLRAYGAFLVSASVDQSGVVSPVSLAAEVGGDVVFASPWAGAAPKVVDGNGVAVLVTPIGGGGYSFSTNVGGTYVISPSS